MRRVALNTTEARSFEPTEPGPYQMVVEKIDDPVKSKGGSGPLGMMIYFKFQNPETDQQCGNVRRWYALEGPGAGFTRELWKSATGEDIPIGEEGFEIDLDSAIGRPVLVTIANEVYEGRQQNVAESVSAYE